MRTLAAIVTLAFLACSCGHRPSPAIGEQITVAAAANLTGVLDEIASSFTKETDINVVLSYGATAQLAQQIENAAPFDLFAAADVEHIDSLIQKRFILPDSRAIYARGVLALWIPKGDSTGVKTLNDLTKRNIRVISVANPKVAPYGQAAVESLQKLKLWQKLEPKVVYATNISMAKQYAASGNADAAFTAYSLVFRETGRIIRVDPSLHAPIDQALGVVTASKNLKAANRFAAFLLGEASQGILKAHGYITPNL